MDFYNEKERELADEMNNAKPSLERRKEIFEELEWIHSYKDMSPKDKEAREKELGIELKSPSFTTEIGKRIYKELEILRSGKVFKTTVQ